MSYAEKIEALVAERDELRRQVHNLNWALSMPGFEQMATPEDQAEHEAGAAAVDAVLARMEHNKAQHDAMVKDAERYRRWRKDYTSARYEGDMKNVVNAMADALDADAVDGVIDAALSAAPAVGAA